MSETIRPADRISYRSESSLVCSTEPINKVADLIARRGGIVIPEYHG